MSAFACDLLIVIVNFRTPEIVVECLESLLPELRDTNAQVTVVDNASGDGSVPMLRTWLAAHGSPAQISLIESAENAGFAAGNNIGIRSSKARSYLLLNSDTLVRPAAIRTLLDAQRSHPKAGLISPRLEWPDGRAQESCFSYHTPASELMAAAQTAAVDRWLKKYAVGRPVQDVVTSPQWTSFACVLIRHEVFEQVGLLDEGYFMYFEDVAFCRQAREAGWDIVNVPQARVVHLRGGSSPVKARVQARKRLPKYFYESRTRYFFQTYGWAGLTAANVMWWLGRVVSKARQLLGRSDKASIQRQWLDIWTNWTAPLRNYTHPQS
ncbi:glycosyltransferase family 2 protein [Piscinibacter sp.]|uniref:glycosyltransferase family 2 protein n=1 Tax=Piscinibacter sp. TaxID=1903157 RepID=UPI002CD80557|nr:glycosyltransferase family 2 protein [Albitalea sp.]HUG23775.1 glycosyltransferase family 2 protein [Albitalea sp.]